MTFVELALLVFEACVEFEELVVAELLPAAVDGDDVLFVVTVTVVDISCVVIISLAVVWDVGMLEIFNIDKLVGLVV